MGIWNGLNRMMQGKPLFEDPEQEGRVTDDEAAPNAPQTPTPQRKVDRFGTPIDDRGYKIIPHIEVQRVQAHRNGPDQIVTAWVINRSDQRVRIDYSRIVSQKQQFNRELTPGEAHELIIYRGKTPMHDHDQHGELVFRLMNGGDEFAINYHVEFHRESDGGYLIEELHPDGPTHDI